jgi:chromosome segregation ATPase
MVTTDELGPETQAKIGGATDGADQLWPLINAADAALDHMRAHVEENGVKGKNGAELGRLLGQPWIRVEGSPQPRTITEVLQQYRKRYDAIRNVVTKINELWLSILPRIDAARATLDRLERETEDLGIPEPLIGRARALAADLEQRLVTDPLGVVDGDGPQLDAQVAAAAEHVAALRTGHDNLDADLSSTEQLLASLRLLRARAEAAASESRAKVVDPQGLVRVPTAAVLDGPKGLADRLDDLFPTTSEASWAKRRALLDSWLTTARKLERQLQRAESVNRQPLVEREELRGRLRAYQAKMAAVGKSEDLELTEIIDVARSELFTAPTRLDAAAAAIDELAGRLRS